MSEGHNPRAEILALRSRVLQAIRAFFIEHDYLEVETPVRLPAPALELHIEAQAAGDQWLRTSPELHLKRLMADGHARLFELGPCFRRDERGAQHRPEFTMLEWYRAEADYRDTLVEARALMVYVATAACGTTRIRYNGTEIDLAADWSIQTVRDAFVAAAGWDPIGDYDADRFDLDLVGKVEPSLAQTAPAVLIDYPVDAAALARCRPGPPAVAERWELYVGGLELANAFSELTDPVEQRNRFLACAKARKKEKREVYPLDEPFLEALESGLTPCSGVALGVDRLVMVLADCGDIGDVRAFG